MEKNIPFVDLKSQYNQIKDEILKEIYDVLDNTAYICGKKAKIFTQTTKKIIRAVKTSINFLMALLF